MYFSAMSEWHDNFRNGWKYSLSIYVFIPSTSAISQCRASQWPSNQGTGNVFSHI